MGSFSFRSYFFPEVSIESANSLHNFSLGGYLVFAVLQRGKGSFPPWLLGKDCPSFDEHPIG